MAHFAEIIDGVVKRVLVAEQDYINKGRLGNALNWVETKYDGSIRKRYAGIGHTYSKVGDVFITPKPYDSWKLDAAYDWQAPSPRPMDDNDYSWDEDSLSWVEIAG